MAMPTRNAGYRYGHNFGLYTNNSATPEQRKRLEEERIQEHARQRKWLAEQSIHECFKNSKNVAPQGYLGKQLAQYSVAVGKAIAGGLRFFCEDLLQGTCQAIYLCKKWYHVSLYTQVFTLCSIFAGLSLSLLGPLKEYLAVRQVKKEAGQELDAQDPAAEALLKDGDKEQENQSKQAGSRTDRESFTEPEWRSLTAEEAAEEEAWRIKEEVWRSWPIQETLTGFLLKGASVGPGLWGENHPMVVQAKRAHRALVASAVLFWAYMVAYPFIYNDELTCTGNPPSQGMAIFFGSWALDILIQVWILVHTRTGYDLVLENYVGFALGCFFSLLGRFDTYGDVLFTAKLLKCEPITWFSIWRHKFYIPFGAQLTHIAIFALVVGVGLIQALPGVILLTGRRRLPLALKLNEFNLLLAAMEAEAASMPDERKKLEETLTQACKDLDPNDTHNTPGVVPKISAVKFLVCLDVSEEEALELIQGLTTVDGDRRVAVEEVVQFLMTDRRTR